MTARRSASVVALLGVLASVAVCAGIAFAKDRKAELQEDLKDDRIVGDWNYDDIDGAFALAAKSGRPVCVVFR